MVLNFLNHVLALILVCGTLSALLHSVSVSLGSWGSGVACGEASVVLVSGAAETGLLGSKHCPETRHVEGTALESGL